jgi:DNA-binding NtrC family response regulator
MRVEQGSMAVASLEQASRICSNTPLMVAINYGYEFGGLISGSRAMESVLLEAELAWTTRMHACFFGESGVGLHALARAIEPRPRAVFAAQACAQCVMEEEFNRAMERAVGGTFVLTQPQELGARAQRAVLDTLTLPVGDIRWIVLSYGPLEGTWAEPRLHEALRPLAVRVPPLRERDDDAVLLARRFLLDLNRQHGRAFADFSPEILNAIRRHSWSGNVRELWYFVAKAVLFGDGDPDGGLLEASDDLRASSVLRAASR